MVTERPAIGDAHTTENSPAYRLFSRDVVIALGVGASLMAVTVAGMLVVADTQLAAWGLWLYRWPLLGVIVFGALLTGGRYLGLRGIGTDNYVLALAGSAISVCAYAWFGGLVLTPYSPAVYTSAVGIAGAITVGITVVAAGYVYSTDQDLSHWARYSMACFLVGFLVLIPALLFQSLVLVTFAFFLLGFLCDLVYEIWMTSNRHRSPAANGLALYIAFAGVFVHVLQIVLRVLADR